jgi:hypothetical protein
VNKKTPKQGYRDASAQQSRSKRIRSAERSIRLGPESLKDPVVQELRALSLPVTRKNYLEYWTRS